MPASVGSIAYRVRVLPERHQLDVAILIDGVGTGPLRLAIPTWVPGAYGFMKYGRDLFDVRARDVAGQELEITREGWSGFVVRNPPRTLEITYRAGAFDPALGSLSGLVSHDQAVLLGTRYLHVPAHSGPVRVRYDLPEGWSLHHPAGAEKSGSEWIYPSYAALLDTPVTAGRFTLESVTVAGTRFDLVYLDDTVAFERERQRLSDAIAAIARACHELFGSFPFESYTFVFSFDPTNPWGLEHANATMIGLEPHTFVDEQQWCDAVRVIAHELFHAWNVCRLKPHPLGAPDHEHGSFPDALWVAEGFTRWYEFLLCCRAGVLSPERLLANVVNYYRHLVALPAYARVSAADSSRATFLNHNKYPGSVNATIDYYDKGLLIAFDLDAALRLQGAGTLDAEFRRFYETFAGRGSGFTSDDAIRFFGERSPGVRALLEREVNAPGGLSTALLLEALGFELVTRERRHLGLVLKESGPVIADVLDTGPAAETGLAPGDEIVRVQRWPWHPKTLGDAILHDDRVELRVRRGYRELPFAITPRPIEELAQVRWNGTREQLDRLSGWFGTAVDFAAGAPLDLGPYDNFHGIQKVV